MFGYASQMLSRMGRPPMMNNRLPGKIQQAQPMPQSANPPQPNFSHLPPSFWAQFSRQQQVAPPITQYTPAQMLGQFGRNRYRIPTFNMWRGR
jgi:hypothetical protein